jgi:phosphoglycerate kinase
VGVTKFIAIGAMGFLIEKEITYLGDALKEPERPFVAVLGGAKISGKIDVIENLLPKVDRLLVGGGMAFTFVKAKGMQIGSSLLESDKVELAGSLLEKGGKKLVLPEDCLSTDRFDFSKREIGKLTESAIDAIPASHTALDIGPLSVVRFKGLLKNAKTIVWNGPMGVFEIEATSGGTVEMAKALAEATKNGATTIIGGGDSAAAVEKAGLADQMTHISTGGGASLEFLEGKVLPGVAALSDR